MKTLIKMIAAVATGALIGAPALSSPVGAADQPKYPDSIAGLPVLFVQTPENTRGLRAGEAVLVLLDNTPLVEGIPTSAERIAEYFRTNSVPSGWSIEVYGGPNATLDSLKKALDEYNAWYAEYGSLLSQTQLSQVQYTAEQTTAAPLGSGSRTFAADLNVDPPYGGNTVTWQSAWWNAPQKYQGAGQYYSYLGNNVQTDTYFFLQAGQIYYASATGLNVWTDTNFGLNPQPFTLVPYVAGHAYQFNIGYSGPSPPYTVWFMSAVDQSAGVYQTRYEYSATGTKLRYIENTSVFFENTNRDPAWWQLFSPYVISVYSAAEVLNGQNSPWHEDLPVIRDQWGQTLPNNGKITGLLSYYGTAQWHLDLLPYVH